MRRKHDFLILLEIFNVTPATRLIERKEFEIGKISAAIDKHENFDRQRSRNTLQSTAKHRDLLISCHYCSMISCRPSSLRVSACAPDSWGPKQAQADLCNKVWGCSFRCEGGLLDSKLTLYTLQQGLSDCCHCQLDTEHETLRRFIASQVAANRSCRNIQGQLQRTNSSCNISS